MQSTSPQRAAAHACACLHCSQDDRRDAHERSHLTVQHLGHFSSDANCLFINGFPSGPKPYEEVLTFLRKVGAWRRGLGLGSCAGQEACCECSVPMLPLCHMHMLPTQGTKLQKYGRHGNPKTHYFRLSSDDTEVQWESKVRHPACNTCPSSAQFHDQLLAGNLLPLHLRS